MPVGEDLDFDMARLFNELLDIEIIIAEGGKSLAAGSLDRGRKLFFLSDQPHSFAATAGTRLHHHGKANLMCKIDGLFIGQRLGSTRHDGHAGLLHGLARRHLVPHRTHDIATRTDKRDPLLGTEICKIAVLCQEPVAGVNRIRTTPLGNLNDSVHHQVRVSRRRCSARIRFIGESHMQGISVDVGIDRDRFYAQLATGADDPYGDLSAIGNQNLLEHQALPVSARN